MGVIIPQVITEDRASGAQVIDGSVGISSFSNSHLKRDPGSAGNRKTFSFSGWVKKYNPTLPGAQDDQVIIEARTSSPAADGDIFGVRIEDDGRISVYDYGNFYVRSAAGRMRDTTGWYHVFFSVDTTVASNNVKLYVNNILVGQGTHAQNTDTRFNSTDTHRIGARADGSDNYWLNAAVTNFYVIDGQALEPTDFGFTDSLTNTWRPKKYTGTYGTNGFYLPMDGNSPVGEDQSGRGNNWTPVNFGGSNTLEKATGALPILNTDGGGKVARVGVRTDANASSLVLALPLVGIKSDFSNAINSGTSNKTVTANGAVANSDANFYGGSYLFDGSDDDISITSSTDFNNIPGDFTIEYWVKHTGTGTFQYHFSLNNTTYVYVYWSAASPNGPYLRSFIQGNTLYNASSLDFQPNQWAHIAMVRSGSGSNNCKLFVNGVVVGQATITTTINEPSENLMLGQNTNNLYYLGGNIQDFRIYKGVAKYTSNFIPASTDPDIVPDSPSGVSYSSNLALVPSTDGAVSFDGSGDYLELADSADFDIGSGDFTIEMFVNPSSTSRQTLFAQINSGGTNASTSFYTEINSSAQWRFLIASGSTSYETVGGTVVANKWTHLAYVRNGSTTTLYADGINIATANVTGVTANNSSEVVSIGRYPGGLNFNGFISNLHFIKGTALYTSNFTPPSAPLTATENTKLLCCKSPTSATAFDVSPGSITANGDAAATNFNPFTVDIDAQRGKQSSYATLNPLKVNGFNANITSATLSNGNLTSTNPGSAAWNCRVGTIGIDSGKWYYEYQCAGTITNFLGGWAASEGLDFTDAVGNYAASYGYYNTGNARNNNSNTSFGASYTAGDVIGCAIDLDNYKIYWSKNGAWQNGAVPSNGTGSIYTNLSTNLGGKLVFPAVSTYDASSSVTCNFGQKPFKFPPPAGFQPLTLANTPRPTIVRPDQYVGIVTYTGNAPSTQTISGLNFNSIPDFVWIKDRDGNYNHGLFDTVRGATKRLSSSSTGSETTYAQSLTSFISNGFVVGDNSDGNNTVNINTNDYVAWCWKAGGNSNTFNIDDVGYDTASAAGLTGGGYAVTGASVNTKSGFSIIQWEHNGTVGGYSMPHGLGRTPKFIITRNIDITSNWGSYHYNYDNGAGTSGINFNSTAAVGGNIGWWNNTGPTSSQFSLGTFFDDAGTFIAYCWAEIPGFSKFGSYTGNGSADGSMVITGFRPRWIMVKGYTGSQASSSQWLIIDTERDSYNVSNKKLAANLSDAENSANVGDSTQNTFDILSNGFKARTTNGSSNNGTTSYIYAAFAEAPTFNLYGAQSNAR